MSNVRKPLSFSMCPLNIAYIKEQVALRKETDSRYSVSQWGDDLITHLRLKAESKPIAESIATVEKPKPPVKRFKPPTVDDVFNYCNERCNNVDAQEFIDHYTANGWMRGKAKIKDWKACVRTWEKNDTKKTQGKTSGNLSACEDFING